MNIAIVGTGNLSYALINAFSEHKDIQLYVYGRNQKKAQQLEKSFGVKSISKKALKKEYDLMILAITDTAIESFSQSLNIHPNTIITHTSGATSINVLASHERYGIFYPLYSFPKKRKVSFAKVPMLLDYSTASLEARLFAIANKLSPKTYKANDQERLRYHIAAVFANNFTNHLLTKAYQILDSNHLEKEVLLPIIKQSCKNWKKGLAETTQSGPALRNDTKTINQHRELLHEDQVSLEIYDFLTKSIQDYYLK